MLFHPMSCRCHECRAKLKTSYRVDDYFRKHKKPSQKFDGRAIRIEKKGIGPFRSRDFDFNADSIKFDYEVLVSMGVPEDEDIYGGVYAFSSMEAMKYYMTPKLLKALLIHGYHVYEYRVDLNTSTLFDGGLQVAFVRKAAVRKELKIHVHTRSWVVKSK